jgi:hypothetical protein
MGDLNLMKCINCHAILKLEEGEKEENYKEKKNNSSNDSMNTDCNKYGYIRIFYGESIDNNCNTVTWFWLDKVN